MKNQDDRIKLRRILFVVIVLLLHPTQGFAQLWMQVQPPATHASPKMEAYEIKHRPEADDYDTEAHVSDIEQGSTGDTKPLRFLIRMPKDIIERIILQVIEEGLKSKDEAQQTRARNLQKKWRIGAFARNKRLQAATIGVLNDIIEKAKNSPEKTGTQYAGLVRVTSKMFDASGSVQPSPERFEKLLDKLPEGLAAAHAALMMKVEVKDLLSKTVTNQPIQIVLQATDGTPKPIPADGFYHGFIDVGDGNDAKVTVRANPDQAPRMLKMTKDIFEGGLFKGIGNQMQLVVKQLPPKLKAE